MSAAITIAALPVASIVLWALLRTALGGRLVAVPTGERWHAAPTPTFGGVGITVGLVAGVLLAVAVGAVEGSWQLTGIIAGALLLFAAGLLDDVRDLSPLAKLAAQFGAAGIAVACGLRVELVGNDVIATVIAVVWLVGITNAFNLLDNMDGLAATLAAVACAYFAIDAVTSRPNDLVLVIALSLGFACVGFLPFNLRSGGSALVFMGDSGSQVLGFLLAALGLAASWTTAGTTVATILLPLLVLAIPILDTTLVTFVRIAERRPVTQGGKDHSSHRLVYFGLSERKAVALLAIIAIALGGTSVAYNILDNARITAIGVLLTFVLLTQFGGFLSDLDERTRRGQESDTSLRHALMFDVRRLVEVLVDFGLVCASFLLSYLVIVGGEGTVFQRSVFLASLPVVLGMRYVAFVAFRIYRRVWRFGGLRDALAIAAAVGISEVLAVGVIWATRPFGDFPVRVFVVNAVICTALIAASRLAFRVVPGLSGMRERGARRRIVIIGAGRAGRSLARELREDAAVKVVAFVDDNPALRGRRIHGVAVIGGIAEIRALLTTARPTEVLVSIPNAPAEHLDRVVQACDEARVSCRFVRRHTETIAPTVRVTAE